MVDRNPYFLISAHLYLQRITLLISFLQLVLLTITVQAEPLHVTMLMAEEGSAYQEFAQSFSGGQQNIVLTISHGNEPLPESNLIVAVGMKSTALAMNSAVPVLSVFVSKSGFDKLQREFQPHRDRQNFSAIYLEQPSKRQVDLIAAALPEAKNIGLLYSSLSPDIANLRKAVAESRLVLRENKVESPDSISRDLQSILQKSDVLLAIPDAQIYNSMTMRNILLSTYHGGIPLVGYSMPYVRAGALCAVFSTPQQFATQANSMIKQFAETGRLPSAQYATEFDVMVNQQVARSLGMQIKETAALIRQIKSAASPGGESK
jgi:ABC-type uncharacterized transport system substrate-binding protein